MAAYPDDLVFKALADPSRRALLDRLNQQSGQTLHDLCEGLSMARQSVSKHLDILERANLITTRRSGREKLHFLNAAPINAIADRWLSQYDRDRAEALADLQSTLEHTRMQSNTFVYTTYINTTPDKLWKALTDPAFTRRYWGVGLVSDWHVGSTVTWEMGGQKPVSIADREQVVLASDPPKKLSYTWHSLTPEFFETYPDETANMQKAAAERRSKVSFEIEPVGELVKLTVIHDDFEPGSLILEGVSQGWPAILASLKTLLETGEPLALA